MIRLKRFLTVFALVQWLSAGACFSQTDAHAELLETLRGEWLSQSYLEALEETRSPIKASGGPVTAFKILKEGDSYQWMQIFGFHEAINLEIYDVKPAREAHSYLVFCDSEIEGGSEKIMLQNPDSFDVLVWIKHQQRGVDTLTFIRARPDIESFINQMVLAGDYTDDAGRRFSFSPSGEARWPDRSFSYQINLDHEGVDCDVFSILHEEEWQGYGFAWRQNKLLIYPVQGVEILSCAKQPLFILTPK